MVSFAFDVVIDATFLSIVAARHFYWFADGFNNFGDCNYVAIFP
jgi:hypothetical protein